MAATVTSRTAAGAPTRAAASAAPAISIAIATTAAGTSLAPTFWTRRTCLYRRNDTIHTVEVRLIIGIELCSAFDHCRGRALWRTARNGWRWRLRSFIRFRRRSPAHLGALLFQNCLPGQLNPVALDSQNFHQHLVAFFQFIANVLDSVLRDFTDMQQPIQARQNLYERPEIRQPAHLYRDKFFPPRPKPSDRE